MSASTATIGEWGVDLTGLDDTVRPRDNFVEFANGTWLRNTSIPKKEARWGPFIELNETAERAIRDILEEISSDTEAEDGSNRQKLRDFYKLGMNSRKLNRERVAPLEPEFERIDLIRTRKELLSVVARMHLYGVRVFWNTSVHPDPSNSDVMMLAIDQGGLTLPERGYYLDEDKLETLDKYEKHIENMFSLLGYSDSAAKEAAAIVLDFETKLAEKSWGATELRDIAPQINYMKIEGLQKIAPHIDWKRYFEDVGVEYFEYMLVGQIEFMQHVDWLLQNTSLKMLKTYLRWKLLSSYANYLSDDFMEESFDFWGRAFEGKKAMKPRWQRCAAVVESALGEALGQEYVERHFPPEAKEKIYELVDYLLEVTGDRIENVDWMTPETKEKALEKLAAFTKKLGYPNKWKDYSGLEIKRDAYVLNCMRARRFHVKDMLSRVGKPTDRDEWHMFPQTVNAYFNPMSTEIVFPAGILQAPFFDPNADDAVNYGAIGAVIGHEITHGFDDMGSQFDKDGNFKNWWTKKDREEFEKRCKKIIEQFSEYEVLPGLFINGELTQGENIADLGGLSIAYEAYLRSLEGKPEPPVLDGFNHKERFFMGFAQIWRTKAREQYLRAQVVNDHHSPAHFRAIGTLQNMDEFFEVFDVQEGDGMWRPPEERLKIW